MTTHGCYRASHHVEHVTSQEGDKGASSARRWGSGQGGHTHQHMRVHAWGKGKCAPMDGLLCPSQWFKPSCRVFPGQLLAVGCVGAPTPCDAVASIIL